MFTDRYVAYGTKQWEVEVIKAREYALAKPGKPFYVATTQKPGWTEPIEVYARLCPKCAKVSETHVAGMGRITCMHCRETSAKVMTPKRLKERVLPTVVFGFVILAVAAAAMALVQAVVLG